MDKFDPSKLALKSHLPKTPSNDHSKPPTHKPGEKFLKGPIPWWWLEKASRLPGKSLHVSIAIWQRVGVKKTATITLSSKLLEELGVDRYAKSRSLKALKEAGLIEVEQSRGKNPVVTLLWSY